LPIIKESIKLIRSSIPTTIDIQLNAEDIEGIVKADPTQIHQILINLCTNAAHAMDEEGGILTISLSEIELDSISQYQFQDVEPGIYVQLTITDTGIGIDSTIVHKVFDPYFTTKEIGKGSGMGLAVVHGIVKSYNGSISIYSEPHRGTTFKILFPSADKESAIDDKSMDKIPTGNEKILFVDDEEALAKIGAKMLEHLGYDVVHETDSLHALALIKADPSQFDLIITDMTMPNLTGDKLTKKILEINPDMPIILCTGFSNKIDSETAVEMGIKQYIDKPFDKTQLAIMVRKALSSSEGTAI
ncbi:MAG: response regulator, partial [Chloroflexi bacterium]|nr:response regulator [Chloroflexota bacterium]